jgi:hypothetical protein
VNSTKALGAPAKPRDRAVHLAAGAEAGGGREQGEARDDRAEDGAGGVRAQPPRRGGAAEEEDPDRVGQPRRPRVLELTLSEPRLDEPEVDEAGDAEAASDREAEEKLRRHQRPGERPAEDGAEESDEPDDRLVEAGRALVDDVGVAPGIGGSGPHGCHDQILAKPDPNSGPF